MNEHIYIVDDEKHIRQLLELGLSEHGFCVRAFEQGEAFLQAVREEMPAAAVLDWLMPAPDGMELIKLLRNDARTRMLPVILLTARAGEADHVQGLEQGADDYITKPFSIIELAARLRALLRRSDYGRKQQNVIMRCGDVELDEEGRTVYLRGAQVALTMREFDLLHALMKNKGRVLTRELLLDTVWSMEYLGDTRTVDVHIRYLRQKLGKSATMHIETVRSIGYRLSVDE